MKKVRIGSVGLGRLGLRHAENIAGRMQNAELAALCDVDKAKLDETAARLGVPNRFTSFDEFIACKDIDAVVLVSPSALHTKQITAALAAGKHVFSEKPLGVTVGECKEAEKA
ncbi:MAG: Gfo/Idh/MocA family oxidoreductase, partial [Treponema sp.]|nr:Gfo/Idh/MocA family oxidoreductase [Treponema sp.]